MAIPDYQTIMLPLLKLASDEKTRGIREAKDLLADSFGLTDDDRLALLPSGKQRTFDNRVAWAKTYLIKAGLLASAGRGYFMITDRGIEELSCEPERIDVDFLLRFPEFREFRFGSDESSTDPSDKRESRVVEATPEELLESTVAELRASLADELLEKIKASSPQFFERLVVELIVAMGYGGSMKDAGQAIGRSGDGGIDGVIKEDRLGLDVIYLQAKRWENTVGRPIIQAFAGSLEGVRARRGIVITTSTFSKEAHEYVQHIEKKIILLDGRRLTDLMIDFDVGVTKEEVFEVKRLDIDFFLDE